MEWSIQRRLHRKRFRSIQARLFQTRYSNWFHFPYVFHNFYGFNFAGALTAGINYYRTNFSIRSRPEPTNSEENHLDGSDGMYVLGQYEKYISAGSLDLTAKSYPKIRVEVIAGANHFLQQHAPKATNDLIWDFLGSADNYPVQTFT